METSNAVSFSSFLAGVLLVHKRIGNLELSILMSKFECENQVDFLQDYLDYDYSLICNYFNNDAHGFRLNVEYDDIIVFNNINYTVYDYLYSFTTIDIRSFLNIPEKNIIELKGKKNKKLV